MARNARLGINVDPLNPAGRPDPSTLDPFGWVRLVLRPGTLCDNYVSACLAAGRQVLAVLGSESFTDHRDMGPELLAYAERYAGRVAVWQLGNEMDIESPASWTMSVAQYVAFHTLGDRLIREIDPKATVITGGSASGLADYLQQCFDSGLKRPDGVAFHPYGQRPDGYPHSAWGHGNLDDLLDRYRALGLPLYASEWGVDEKDVSWTDDKRGGQAEYILRVGKKLLTQPDLKLACIYCWSDGMQ